MIDSNDVPLISVGMPVYNGESSVGCALDSILAQTVDDLEVIVSDNASSDGTLALCESRAARDSRVQILRQPANVGAVRNFVTVLRAARAPFFMWAAADDVWSSTFAERNLALLQSDPALVASVSRARFTDAAAADDEVGTRPLTEDVNTNLLAYLRWPGPNSRFYAVYRRDVLLRSLPAETFLAWDWAVVARTLTFGGHGRVDDVLFSRGAQGESQNLLHVIRRYNQGLGKVLPLYGFTAEILKDPRVPKSLRLFALLAKHNLAYVLAAARQTVQLAKLPAWSGNPTGGERS